MSLKPLHAISRSYEYVKMQLSPTNKAKPMSKVTSKDTILDDKTHYGATQCRTKTMRKLVCNFVALNAFASSLF
jgi:hypothetical protein